MKSSVLSVLVLFMILSFGINAFAAPSAQVVNARLKQLIPAGQSGLMSMGMSADGRDCEVSIGANAKGDVGVMISVSSMMGTKHFIFDVVRNRTLTAAADKKNQIILQSINNEGLNETLILGLSVGKNGRSLRSAELIGDVSGMFGTKTKSLINCSI